MSRTSLHIETIETAGLGDRSYVAILDGWAFAVDVQRDLDRVEEILASRKARLAAVVETHIHNDYLTGGLALARRHRAEYVVPAGPRLGYTATRAVEGAEYAAGALSLRAIDSPGHTDAHTAYSLHIEGGPAQFAFTGGSLLLGATGRSDLLGADLAEGLARKQYWSVRRMARILGAEARILPTHGFGSFCVAGTTAPSGDTVAEQLEANPAYLLDEDAFVDDLLSKLGDYPTYYAFMGPRNSGGVDLAKLDEVPTVDLVTALDTAARGDLVVDIRARAAWAEAHLKDSLSVDAAGAVATWYGWVTPIDKPVLIISDSDKQASTAVRELSRIGVDDIVGVHVTRTLAGLGEAVASATPMSTFHGLAEQLEEDPSTVVIDTRETAEWRGGHVAGAVHVSAHDVDAVFGGALPLTVPWLYCGAGFRATIAASLLERLGCASVVVDDHVATAEGAGVEWCAGENCSDQLCTRSLVMAANASH